MLVAWDAAGYTATVEFDGSGLAPVSGIRTNRGIASAELVVGRRVVVDIGENNIAAEFVVVAVYEP